MVWNEDIDDVHPGLRVCEKGVIAGNGEINRPCAARTKIDTADAARIFQIGKINHLQSIVVGTSRPARDHHGFRRGDLPKAWPTSDKKGIDVCSEGVDGKENEANQLDTNHGSAHKALICSKERDAKGYR